MKTVFKIILLVNFITLSVLAQQTTFQDSLLDRMTGEWVLSGTIAGKETTHDINVEWVLAHQYIQLHEISREKDSTGQAEYEAIVYIGWEQAIDEYTCLWLDITGNSGLSANAIAHAMRGQQ
jgi:hypothetical protein